MPRVDIICEIKDTKFQFWTTFFQLNSNLFQCRFEQTIFELFEKCHIFHCGIGNLIWYACVISSRSESALVVILYKSKVKTLITNPTLIVLHNLENDIMTGIF